MRGYNVFNFIDLVKINAMQKLTELETSVSKLSDIDYAKFRQWFWKHENERWDAQLENDVAEKRLDTLANKAIEDFKQGNYKLL